MLLELLKAEEAIKEASKIRNDQVLLAAIEGTLSLRAAEYKVHDKCQKDYTRVCPAKTKRNKDSDGVTDKVEDMEGPSGFSRGYFLRDRPARGAGLDESLNPEEESANEGEMKMNEGDNTEDVSDGYQATGGGDQPEVRGGDEIGVSEQSNARVVEEHEKDEERGVVEDERGV